MRYLKLMAVLIGSFFLAQPGYSLVDGQVLVGKRSQKIEGDGSDFSEDGTELKIAAHVDPIPLVPVAFGLSYSNVTFDDTDFDDFTGSEIDVEVMAWLPLDLFGLAPYARLGYTVAGAYEAEGTVELLPGNEVKRTYVFEVNGVDLAVGLKWSPLPLLSLMLEGEMGNKKIKLKEVKGLSGDVESTEDDFKSTTIFLGVEVGI